MKPPPELDTSCGSGKMEDGGVVVVALRKGLPWPDTT
jgi:hypothetical protein